MISNSIFIVWFLLFLLHRRIMVELLDKPVDPVSFQSIIWNCREDIDNIS